MCMLSMGRYMYVHVYVGMGRYYMCMLSMGRYVHVYVGMGRYVHVYVGYGEVGTCVC